MKTLVYPVIFEKDGEGFLVTIPDLQKNTQGRNLAEAISMARDLISLILVDLEDDGKELPLPNTIKYKSPINSIFSYVDVDLTAYRQKYGAKLVKKNCTIPAWLNTRAEKMKINFSQTLHDALISKLNDA